MNMLIKLRITPDKRKFAGFVLLKRLSPIITVPLRTTTSHFRTIATLIPLVPPLLALSRALQAFLGWKSSRRTSTRRRCQVSGRLRQISWIEVFFGWRPTGCNMACAGGNMADWRWGWARSNVLDGFFDSYFFKFNWFWAGGEVSFLRCGRIGFLKG